MDGYFIEPISLADIDGIFAPTMTSLFWENGVSESDDRGGRAWPTFAGPREHDHSEDTPPHQQEFDEPEIAVNPITEHLAAEISAHVHEQQLRLEKEAWRNAVFMSWGPCGLSLKRDRGSGEKTRTDTLGTLLFAPPRFSPTTFAMPSGPISPDAVALTSLHYDDVEVDGDMQRALIVVALQKLALRGISAVEAYGCSGTYDALEPAEAPTLSTPPTLALSDDLADEAAIFEEFGSEVEETASASRCHSHSLGAINHDPGEMIRTKALISAGFQVVSPHPVHPRLRIELDADLDWDEAVGRALDRSATQRFYRPTMYLV